MVVELTWPAERRRAVRAAKLLYGRREVAGEVVLEVSEHQGEFAEGAILEQLAAADDAAKNVHAAACGRPVVLPS
jgi:hypothetical protein